MDRMIRDRCGGFFCPVFWRERSGEFSLQIETVLIKSVAVAVENPLRSETGVLSFWAPYWKEKGLFLHVLVTTESSE